MWGSLAPHYAICTRASCPTTWNQTMQTFAYLPLVPLVPATVALVATATGVAVAVVHGMMHDTPDFQDMSGTANDVPDTSADTPESPRRAAPTKHPGAKRRCPVGTKWDPIRRRCVPIKRARSGQGGRRSRTQRYWKHVGWRRRMPYSKARWTEGETGERRIKWLPKRRLPKEGSSSRVTPSRFQRRNR